MIGSPRIGSNTDILVDRFLQDVPVCLWLGGHIHFSPRTPAWAACRNGTTFINVASPSHGYNKDACHTFVLELADGSRRSVARCRNHDRGFFDGRQAVEIRWRRPVRLSPSGPRFEPVKLDVPDRYAHIDEEQVVHF